MRTPRLPPLAKPEKSPLMEITCCSVNEVLKCLLKSSTESPLTLNQRTMVSWGASIASGIDIILSAVLPPMYW